MHSNRFESKRQYFIQLYNSNYKGNFIFKKWLKNFKKLQNININTYDKQNSKLKNKNVHTFVKTKRTSGFFLT